MNYCIIKSFSVFFVLALSICGQSDDPIIFNPVPDSEPVTITMIGDTVEACRSYKSGSCADVWEPVCDVEEVLTYPNCCEAIKQNVTEIKLGLCCPDCPMFGASEEPFGIPGTAVDEYQDLNSDTNSRKLLDTKVSQNVTELFNEANIDPNFIPGVVFESIQGTDERVLVEITDQFPFAAVGILESGCTAFLVGPRHALTAGHCIFNQGEWLTDLKFSPGQNNDVKPFKEIDWYAARVSREWFDDQSVVDYDYGMIYLTEEVGNQTGILDFQANCGRKLLPLNLLGYPTDKKPENTMWLSRCGNVQYDCTKTTFLHMCDTYAGMSGGPMFLYEAAAGNTFKFTVAGIHFGNSNGTENEGITMTEEMVADIVDWIVNDSSDTLP